MGRKHELAAIGVPVLILLTIATGCAAPIPGTATHGEANPPPNTNRMPKEFMGTVIDEANVRAGPGMDHDVVANLALGSQVTVSCASGEWIQLATPNPGGYVYSSLLSIQGAPKPC
jgi:hypothetical protein